MNPATAGLGALPQSNTQPGNMPTGMPPQNMSATMALAKKMSDMQLADVLAGKNMDVPQFVAMTEAMGRKQLRTAMQGMTAMTTAKQPTEREKLLSEMMPRQPQQTIMSVPSQGAQPAPQGAGLDQLPADNMQGLGHANGGIIAFSGDGPQGQQVKDPRIQAEEDRDFLRRAFEKTYGYMGDIGNLVNTPYRMLNNATIRGVNMLGANMKPIEEPGIFSESRKVIQNQAARQKKDREGVDPTDASDFLRTLKPAGVAPPITNTAPSTTNTAPPTTNTALPAAGAGAGTDLASFAQKQADLLRPKERDADYYAALTRPIDDIANQVASGKEQAKGEFLMNLGAGLLSKPNLAMGLSEGVNRGLPGLAASRKESNALLKDQRDYQFNIAKAKEARDQGNEMLALNYMKLAEESKYHEAYVKALTARAGGADKTWGRENITMQQGLKAWKDLSITSRQQLQKMGINPENYYMHANSGNTWVPSYESLPSTDAQVLRLPQAPQ